MDHIVDSVWIGSLTEASDLAGLRAGNIQAIVSIGCEAAAVDGVEYCSFPDLLDMPETNLLVIFERTTAFIAAQVASGKQVLVHCVYGQSRSASVIAAYMVLGAGRSIEFALDILKEKHSSICINPGFLSQLHLLSSREIFKVEYELLTAPNKRTEVADDIGIGSESDAPIECIGCGFRLGSILDTVKERDNINFMRERLDPFWSDYPSANKRKGVQLCVVQKESLAMKKLPIFSAQIEKMDFTEQEQVKDRKKKRKKNTVSARFPLNCPNCDRSCGYYSPTSLLLCNTFLLADLTALFLSAVKIIDISVVIDEGNDIDADAVNDDEQSKAALDIVTTATTTVTTTSSAEDKRECSAGVVDS
jgi:hypothetical protein